MFSVVTPRIWVSPRWKIAEPCTRGMTCDLGVERTDVGKSTSIDAHALGEDASTDDLLRDGLVRGRELESRDGLKLAGLDGREQLALDAVLERVVGGLTLDLVGDLVDADELVVGAVGDEVVRLLAVRREDRVVRDLLRRPCSPASAVP